MKTKIYIIFISALSILFSGCEDVLDTKVDTALTDEMLATDNYYLQSLAYKAYSYIPNGFSSIDNNLFAGVTDEAQYVTTSSDTRFFNDGTWTKFDNPVDRFATYYQGIYEVHYFLQKSENYVEILAVNRDTLTSAGISSYLRDLKDVERLKAESHVLKAYYYFELFKRYGEVPIINELYDNPDDANLPRNSVDDIVKLIVEEIDSAKTDLVLDWTVEKQVNNTGRITLGTALAIKARALLYAASPQFNTSNAADKWEKAAAAANDVILLGVYELHTNYSNLFLDDNTNKSIEAIWLVKEGQNNDFEKANYPIGTPGGATGICPSHNLFDVYESNDPRRDLCIAKNGDSWNGRILEIYNGGTDDPAKPNTSPTGYYLKKFLNADLNLLKDASKIRSWVVIRYAEVLLNFAEAINEVHGPDVQVGYAMTARQAIDMIRARVGLAGVNVPDGDKNAMRAAIKHERRVELAFEDHRYWDLRRWDDANDVLNQPITGVETVLSETDTIQNVIHVSHRKFDASKMNLFPIPESAIVNSKGVLTQNPGW